jgi:hypothetical protein
MKGIKIEPVTISTYKQSDPLASMYFHPASPLPWSWIANGDAYPQINRHGNHTSGDHRLHGGRADGFSLQDDCGPGGCCQSQA